VEGVAARPGPLSEFPLTSTTARAPVPQIGSFLSFSGTCLHPDFSPFIVSVAATAAKSKERGRHSKKD
jgi:hypothetical protein